MGVFVYPAVSDSAALVDRVKALQEELAAMINERTSQTLFTLTICTVLALPVNMIAGLFGMNVGGIPFGQSGGGFFVVATTLLGCTGLLAYFALRRRQE